MLAWKALYHEQTQHGTGAGRQGFVDIWEDL